MQVKRVSNKNGIFIRFLRILEKRLPIFIFAMIIHMVGDNLFNVILCVFVKNVVDMAQRGNMERFGQILVLCISLGIMSLLIFFVFGAVYDIEAKRGNAKVQSLVFEKALKLPMSYYDNHHSGSIVSKILNDAETASQIFTSRFRRVTTPIMSVIVYLIPMVILSPQLALCLVGINVLTLLVNSKYMEPMKKIGKEMSQKKSSMTEQLSTMIQGIDSMKMYSGGGKMADRYKNTNNEYASVMDKYYKNSAVLGTLNTFFDLVCALAFLAIAVVFISKGWTTVGNVAAIYTLYGSFSSNFLQLGKYLPELMNCIATAQIVFDFLDEQEEIDAPEKYEIVDKNGNKINKSNKKSNKNSNENSNKHTNLGIEFKNVTFSYDNGINILDDFSLCIEKSKNTALTGKSGKGKSTIIKLLLGFYKISSGEIIVDGYNINNIELYELRDKIAYVPQQPFLFHVSIKENIRYGKLDATEEEIVEAAKAAYAHEFIMNLPDGYHTIAGENGSRLSGGECQRIAVARAFIKNAEVLLLDEATSSLDNESENAIQTALYNLLKNRTTLTIAHKPATIMAADYEMNIG